MIVIGIDPGPIQSGIVSLKDGALRDAAVVGNEFVRDVLSGPWSEGFVAIEQIRSYGMAVGAEVFDTCVETGRFVEAASRRGSKVLMIPRMDVKMHLCHSPKAKDANIRQALIDRFGSAKKGGVLFGVTGHAWAALAVAVTAMDRIREGAKAA